MLYVKVDLPGGVLKEAIQRFEQLAGDGFRVTTDLNSPLDEGETLHQMRLTTSEKGGFSLERQAELAKKEGIPLEQLYGATQGRYSEVYIDRIQNYLSGFDKAWIKSISGDANPLTTAIANVMGHEFGHQVGLEDDYAGQPFLYDRPYASLMTLPLMPGTLFSTTPRLWSQDGRW